ncbi:MAG: glycosyltransferase family 4 protein [Chitinophagales bacterium]|nr:glycosyltransferase family 4 protein [Chitinophagaceae bacterium]MCB9063704.1 glycosyltransferase family 4 protein [Chitinophagales bacterium]
MADTGKIRVLSIAPYKIIPPTTGGQLAITKLHHYLGALCNDNVVSTVGNADGQYAFALHKIFPDKPVRYLPGYGIKKMLKVAEENNITHIVCEHPYMSITTMTLAKKLGVPWYMRSHNIESERFRTLGKSWWPILKRYERFAMQNANGIFFITPEDAEWAIENFSLAEDKCHIVPFGTDMQQPTTQDDNAKTTLSEAYGLNPSAKWLYFLGALNYKPNEDAVKYIIEDVLPVLKSSNEAFEILIAGKGLSETLQTTIGNTDNIHYTGFVPDLDIFLNACDVMLNPVMTGGGIKTKAIEALGYNNTVVSSHSGAAGISRPACGEKLIVTDDYDWDAFSVATIRAIRNDYTTPEEFYAEYYHGNIAQKVYDILAAGSR